jgi:hypothetical protein
LKGLFYDSFNFFQNFCACFGNGLQEEILENVRESGSNEDSDQIADLEVYIISLLVSLKSNEMIAKISDFITIVRCFDGQLSLYIKDRFCSFGGNFVCRTTEINYTFLKKRNLLRALSPTKFLHFSGNSAYFELIYKLAFIIAESGEPELKNGTMID